MHPTLAAIAAQQNGVFTRAQAQAAGYTIAEIRGLVAADTWRVLRRGAMTTARHCESADTAAKRHLLLAAAALLLLHCEPVLSHRSAVLAWDLPLLGAIPSDVELTTSRQNRRRSTGLAIHTARTPPHHRAAVGGLAVTTPARTISDVARSSSVQAALVVADTALHRQLCTVTDLEQVVRDCWTWRGIPRTKRMIAFADGRSESPGESLSRLAIADHGLPEPELQREFVLEGRTVRVDFYWPAARLVGEFDGRIKYDDPNALWDEKEREDLLRRNGEAVARWGWSDVYPDPVRLVRRLERALATRTEG